MAKEAEAAYLQHRRAELLLCQPPAQAGKSTWPFATALQSGSCCNIDAPPPLHRSLASLGGALWRMEIRIPLNQPFIPQQSWSRLCTLPTNQFKVRVKFITGHPITAAPILECLILLVENRKHLCHSGVANCGVVAAGGVHCTRYHALRGLLKVFWKLEELP